MKRILPAIAVCLLLAMNVYSNTQVVNVSGFSFTPANFTINLGDTVKWILGSSIHTSTSTTIPAGAAPWNFTGTTGIYIPTKTGVYNYKCTPHESMGMVAKFTVVSGCPTASAHISAASATTFCSGGSAQLNSTVSANITAYQWKKNGNNIANATTPTFTAKTAGSYTLMVTNNCGNTATSNAIAVTVNPLPAATVTPSGTVNICTGSSVKLQANTGTGLTYQWTKNGVNIAGATMSSFTATTAGNYRVVVTRTSTGCKKTSAATKVTVTQCITDTKLPDNGIKLFPNPSSGDFHISIPIYNNQYSLSVFDGNGNAVSNNKSISKEFSFGGELRPGMYMIQIKKGNAIVFEEKIIKE
jgi:plastocyanin